VALTLLLVALAISLSGMLMMRFRKRWLARINLAITNRITSLFAARVPGFGIITHIGRKSGRRYRTPINVFRNEDRFAIALTYSQHAEWVKNVLAAGGCELETRGVKYRLSSPKVVHDPARRPFPFLARIVLRIVGASDYIELAPSTSK
jgi:deazaflavin-dependent oxidoreductase (nitroreductase family)